MAYRDRRRRAGGVQENERRVGRLCVMVGPQERQREAGRDERHDRRRVGLVERRRLLVRVFVAQGRALPVGLGAICHRLAGTVQHRGAARRDQVWTRVRRHGQLHEQQADQSDDGAQEARLAWVAHGRCRIA